MGDTVMVQLYAVGSNILFDVARLSPRDVTWAMTNPDVATLVVPSPTSRDTAEWGRARLIGNRVGAVRVTAHWRTFWAETTVTVTARPGR